MFRNSLTRNIKIANYHCDSYIIPLIILYFNLHQNLDHKNIKIFSTAITIINTITTSQNEENNNYSNYKGFSCSVNKYIDDIDNISITTTTNEIYQIVLLDSKLFIYSNLYLILSIDLKSVEEIEIDNNDNYDNNFIIKLLINGRFSIIIVIILLFFLLNHLFF